jgi:hypothetical protein
MTAMTSALRPPTIIFERAEGKGQKAKVWNVAARINGSLATCGNLSPASCDLSFALCPLPFALLGPRGTRFEA